MRSLSTLLLASALTLPLLACDKPAEQKPAAEGNSAKPSEAPVSEAKPAEPTALAAAAGDGCEEQGCIHAGSPAGGHECGGGTAANPAVDGHLGTPFVLADAQPLSTALASAPSPEAVKVSGTVESVCQAKGCWMVLKDGDKQARVLVKDHAFAIPMDGKGKKAVVEGVITSKELSQANVDHLRKDGDPNIGTEPKTEFFLEATALELTNS